MNSEHSISYQIALNSGQFEFEGTYLKPKANSGIAELFNHGSDHNAQGYIKQCNKDNEIALIIGGSEYTLKELANKLVIDLNQYKQRRESHNTEYTIDKLQPKQLSYWTDHNINRNILKEYRVIVRENENEKWFFVPCYSDKIKDNGKRFILDNDYNVTDKRTISKGKNVLFPASDKDNGDNILIVEGIPDCLKARQEGYNAFTWSGGVNEIHKIAGYFNDRTVYICVDKDEASQKELPKIYKAFFDKSNKVFIIDLPFTIEQKEKDFCDYFKTYTKEDFDELIKNATKQEKIKNILKMSRKSALELIEDLLNIFENAHLLYFKGKGFYNYDEGYYKQKDTEYFNNIAYNYLKDKSYLEKNQRYIINGFIETLKNASYKEDILNNDKTKLNLINGLYNLETYELENHSPNHYSSIRLPITFDEKNSPERFIEFVSEITNNDKELYYVIQEMFGYCLTTMTKYEKAFILYGSGSNGKSTLLEILKYMIGIENVCSVPLHNLSNPFEKVSLFGKLINICSEVDNKVITSEEFKKIITGDIIQASYKFKDFFLFNPFCKLIFAMNELPKFRDDTYALFRRLLIIPFEITFKGKNQDKSLIDKLKKEINGIFNWSLIGLKRLKENDNFTNSERINKELEEFKSNINSVSSFIKDKCELDKDEYIETKDLYKQYNDYCIENGYKPFSSKEFGKKLKNENIFAKHQREGDKSLYVYCGIKTLF